jgi:hypothetical protein
VREALAKAERVVASDLTLVECDCALLRAQQTGRLTENRVSSLRGALRRIEGEWSLLRLSRRVVARAREPFPGEPLRALDALHLASLLALKQFVPELVLLSLDRRLRAAGRTLGFPVAPSA